MSRERAFNFSQDISEMAKARAGAQASKTVLRIFRKLSSEYLGIFVAATGVTATRVTVIEGFVSKGPAGCLDNLSSTRKVEKSQGKQWKE